MSMSNAIFEFIFKQLSIRKIHRITYFETINGNQAMPHHNQHHHYYYYRPHRVDHPFNHFNMKTRNSILQWCGKLHEITLFEKIIYRFTTHSLTVGHILRNWCREEQDRHIVFLLSIHYKKKTWRKEALGWMGMRERILHHIRFNYLNIHKT